MVMCPACGGIVEADDDEALYIAALAHTTEAHDYRISREHVLAAAEGDPATLDTSNSPTTLDDQKNTGAAE
jgi:hypothetical protein